MSKDFLRIIGDVHGLINLPQKPSPYNPSRKRGRTYLNVANAAENSIQVGDMGFNYHLLKQKLNPNKHRFFGGNHDNYDTINSVPHNLGDFGVVTVGGLSLFFCRGAFSVDKKRRLSHEWATGQKIWWQEEELTYAQSVAAIKAYEQTRPRFMLSHSCPQEVSTMVGSPGALRNFGIEPEGFTTSTQTMLQSMFEIHEPELWIFGHFHKNWLDKVRDTTFICVDELSHVHLNERGEIQ